MTNDSETVREMLLSVEKHAKTCRDDFERGVFNQQTQVMGTIFNDFFIRLTMANDREVSAYEREMAAKDEEIARLKSKCDEYERQPELMAETANAALELIKSQDARIALLERALKPVMECEIESLGPFPLIVEPNAKVDIYRTDIKSIDDLCGITTNPAPVFKHDNLIVYECINAPKIAEGLNAVRDAKRIMKEGGEK